MKESTAKHVSYQAYIKFFQSCQCAGGAVHVYKLHFCSKLSCCRVDGYHNFFAIAAVRLFRHKLDSS